MIIIKINTKNNRRETKKKIKKEYLIYCGTKNGLKGEFFWKSVNEK